MVRMLADRARPATERINYPNAFRMLLNLPRKEYMVGFVPNVSRATIVTASQLVSLLVYACWYACLCVCVYRTAIS